MKSQIKRFSKSTLSVILSLCMLVSCMTVGIIATDAAYDDSESIGYDTVGIHTNATISGGWETTNLDTSDGNHYTGTIYFKGKSSGNYEMGMQVAGNWKVFGGYWINSGTAYNTAWGSGGSSNDQIPPSSTNTSKYIKGEVEFYKEYSGKPWLKITQTVLNDLATTATVGKTSLTSGGTTTVGNTSSGGSGSYTHEYTVKQGSASGTDVTNATLGSSTGTTFTAPSVSSNTTYYITHTLTDNNTGATVTSSAKTITVSPATTPSIDSFTIDGSTSKTLNIGETATLASTKSNSTNTVTYSTTSDAISITGTTVKALKPVSSVTITASLTGATSKTVNVTVRTPQFSLSYSPSSIPATGSATSTPTANINTSYANSSSTMSSLSYSITSGTSYASINSSTGVVTSKTSDGTVTVKVTGTISHNGVSYTSAEGTATVTVSSLPSVYFDVVYNKSSGWSDSDNKGGSMTYDSAASTTLGSMVFKLTTSSNLVANGSYYLRIWDGSANYRPSSEISSQQLLSGSGVSCDKVNETKKMTAGAAGKYNFYYDVTNHRVYVEYPHTVTFNMNGHGTAPTSQTINYGGKVTKPNDPSAAGYTFGGWYKEAACTNAWNFSSDTVTANTNLYAKWTNLPPLDAPTIKYNNSTTATRTMNASKGSKARITWAAITNAGSYEIFKDNVSLGTTTDLYYDIERGNSYGGTYTVKAIPSNPNSYSTSVASNGIKFTFNKVALTKPTVSISATEIGVGESTTVTISNYSTLSAYVTAGNAVIRRCTRTYNATTGSGTNDGSPTSSSDVLTPASSIQYFYYMEVTADGRDYYTQSDDSDYLDIYVSVPKWYLTGDLVRGHAGTSEGWKVDDTAYAVNEYVSKNVFSYSITTTESGNHYFRLYKSVNGSQYGPSNSQDTDMTNYDGSTNEKKLTASGTSGNGAMFVSGKRSFKIYVDQSSDNPVIWVEATSPEIKTTTIYVNKDSGATHIHLWSTDSSGNGTSGAITTWPGNELSTVETINDIKYYKYTFESDQPYFGCLFNKGSDTNKSNDLKSKATGGTYYLLWNGTYVNDVIAEDTAPVVQLGYKVKDTSTDLHASFTSRSVSLNLAANTTYEFWLKPGIVHYNDELSGTMTRANSTNWTFPIKNSNTKITTDLEGTYTFTYTVSGDNFVVSVDYPTEPLYNVTINQGNHGTVTVNGNPFVSGTNVLLGPLTKAEVQAIPVSGYHFVRWEYLGGTTGVNSSTQTSNPITIGAENEAGSLTAIYEENSYTLTLESAGNGSITTPASKTMTVHPYTATSLSGVTVTPDDGYKFSGWTAGTNVTLTDGSTSDPAVGTVKASQDSTLTATFTKVSYSLTGKTSLSGTVGNYGTVKFYSNPGCTTEIETSQIGNTVYAKFSSDTYSLVDFTLDGTGTSEPTTNGNIFSFKMGYSDVTLTANVAPQPSVTYYVDMHNNNMTDKTVQVAIVTNAGGTTVAKDGNGADCSATLVKQGDSTVYAAKITTPITMSGSSTYNGFYLRITYGTISKPVFIGSSDATDLMSSNSPEVWIEAQNEVGNEFKVTFSTNTGTAVESGKKRIYVAKPFNWETNDKSWHHIHLYHWGGYEDIGWDQAPLMTHIGSDSEYHYYYIDVDSNVNNIIFQGWKENSTAPDVQTGNIENIGNSNYFILSKDGSSYLGTKGDNATVPSYTRYVQSVDMNVGENANIAPTTNAKVTYTCASSHISISEEGVVTANSSSFGESDVSITVKVFGSVGAKATSANPGDYMTYTCKVSVRNPGVLNNYKIMSFAHQEYTVKIDNISGTQPGYFDLTKTSALVNGLYDGSTYTTSYAKSAIIVSSKTVDDSVVGTVTTEFTVKYAASNSSKGYSNITINNATIVTKSIKHQGQKRYGFKEWNPAQSTATKATVIENGVETVTHKGISFSSGTSTYNAVFEYYDYVDVTFTFNYYEYKPKVDADGMINYPYDAAWAFNEDKSNADFENSHTKKTVKIQNYEVRGKTASDVQKSDLVTPALAAIGVLPTNNYYKYSIAADDITISDRNPTSYSANATVDMSHSVKEYRVYLNGELKQRNVQGDTRKTYYYQEYAELTVNTASDWYAVESRDSNDTTNAPLLATGVNNYKFRVKGSDTDNNTYLRTTDATNPHGKDFLRSEVDFSHYEVTHQGSTPTSMKEYLMQNFYIADFFSPSEVLDTSRPKEGGGYLPHDDAQFVGGGVVYYSMKGVTENSQGTPFANAVSSGYVGNDGKINANAVKEMLKSNIEAQYAKDNIAGTAGEETAMKVAYGTEIEATKNVEGGFNTGIIYRYLPLNQYKRDAQGKLLNPDEDGDYAYDVNTNTFRYSNTLQSYQYVYASGNENKETNAGKNMRLYSYYVYSYVAYNQETNVPETKYEIVLSDNYSDASTYWNGK